MKPTPPQILRLLPTLALAIILLGLLAQICWPKNPLETTKLTVAAWPQFEKSHLNFSQVLFDNGHYWLAATELEQADKALSFLTPVGLLKATEDKIREPEKIKQTIILWEEIEKQKPWYRDLLLNLALIYDRLYQKEETESYFEKAFYLDPLNPKVQAVGKKLGFL